MIYYDDIRTKWDIDYIELYDLEGRLLLVSWVDRFGVCQVAMDRGLLDADNPKVEGVLVDYPRCDALKYSSRSATHRAAQSISRNAKTEFAGYKSSAALFVTQAKRYRPKSFIAFGTLASGNR